jgi:hypothetical protein
MSFMFPASDCARPALNGRWGLEVNASRTSFTGRSDNPTTAAQESGTFGEEGTKAKPLAVGTTLAALLFCGSSLNRRLRKLSRQI